MAKILIALTDKDEAIKVNNHLKESGHDPYIVTDSQSLISKAGSHEYDFIILGLEIIESLELSIASFISERSPGTHIIVVTRQESINRAVSLARNHGFSYLTRPCNLEELDFLIEKNPSAKEGEVVDDYFDSRFIGKSEKIRKIMEIVRKVAKNDSNILITGETGTGKELIARAVYELSSRSSAPFIAVNSSAIPENLLESELFGYKKGAFTGAVADKKGLIELADNGTLFLDEIGDLSLNLQAKLLRVLEYKELRRLGDETLRKVNIRVIAATNQDLGALMKEKKFREDLFFRINVIHVHIPPLRERMEDIPMLVRFYLEKYNKSFGKNMMGIDPRAKTILMKHEYPGNVRELDNIMQHAFAMNTSGIITSEDLPLYLQNISVYPQLHAHGQPGGAASKGGNDGNEFLLSAVEKRTIILALERFERNHTKAAKALGISRSTLWRKMNEYGITA